MGLHIEHRDNRDFPIIICDHCDAKVERAEEGCYTWRSRQDGKPRSPMHFTHNECLESFTSQRDGVWGSGGLRRLPFYLENNLDVDRETVEELVARGL